MIAAIIMVKTCKKATDKTDAAKPGKTDISPPKYEIIGTGLRVYFPALKSALIDQPKVPKVHSAKTDGTLDDTMALKIIEILRSKPDITLDQLSAETGIARRTLVRYMSGLKDAGRIERIGGKRYGHWQISE